MLIGAKFIITSHLGRKPVRGGRPAKDIIFTEKTINDVMWNIGLVFIWFDDFIFVSLKKINIGITIRE